MTFQCALKWYNCLELVIFLTPAIFSLLGLALALPPPAEQQESQHFPYVRAKCLILGVEAEAFPFVKAHNLAPGSFARLRRNTRQIPGWAKPRDAFSRADGSRVKHPLVVKPLVVEKQEGEAMPY